MAGSPRFGRVLTAMVSPFDADGALDLDGAAKLASWLVEQGNEGLVIAGTTGESPTLTHDEQAALVRVVAESVSVPVIAGAGSNDTAAAIDLTHLCEKAGADGILHVGGYYNRPSQEGFYQHFKTVAQASDLPVMLYDIPVRTGRKIETETLLRLAHDLDNIVALKDAAGDVAETAKFIREAPDGFEVYSGDDPLTLPFLSVGAVGVVSVAAHWCAEEIAAMFTAFAAGDVAEATRLNALLLDSFDFETSLEAPNPVPTKAMMKVLGQPGGDCRLPMGPEPDGLQDQARDVLAGLGRLLS